MAQYLPTLSEDHGFGARQSYALTILLGDTAEVCQKALAFCEGTSKSFNRWTRLQTLENER